MAIIIDFKNPNTEDSLVEIFRSEEKISKDNLPEEPIVALSDGETSYRDNDLELGKTYYYMLRTTVGDSVYHSPSIRRKNTRDTGAGPQELVTGDENFGYYGMVMLAEIMPVSSLNAVTHNTSLTLRNDEHWHKFAYRGRTLFIPHMSGSGWQVSNYTTGYDVVQARAAQYVAMVSTGDEEKDLLVQEVLWKTWAIPEESRIRKIELQGGSSKYRFRLPRMYDTYPEITVNTDNVTNNGFIPKVEGISYGEIHALFSIAGITINTTTPFTSEFQLEGAAWKDRCVGHLQLYGADMVTTPSTVWNNMRYAYCNTSNRNVSTNPGGAHVTNSISWSYLRIVPVLEVIEG